MDVIEKEKEDDHEIFFDIMYPPIHVAVWYEEEGGGDWGEVNGPLKMRGEGRERACP